MCVCVRVCVCMQAFWRRSWIHFHTDEGERAGGGEREGKLERELGDQEGPGEVGRVEVGFALERFLSALAGAHRFESNRI